MLTNLQSEATTLFQPFKYLIQINRLFVEILVLFFVEFVCLAVPDFTSSFIKDSQSRYHELAIIFPFGITEKSFFVYITIFYTLVAIWFGTIAGIQKVSYEYNAVYPFISRMPWFLQAWYEPIDTFKKDIHTVGQFLGIYRFMIKKESSYYETEFYRHYTLMMWIGIIGIVVGLLQLGYCALLIWVWYVPHSIYNQVLSVGFMILWKCIASMTCYIYRKKYTKQMRQNVF